MTTENPVPAKSRPTVDRTIKSARQVIGEEEFLAVADCIDVLLDCYNASTRPEVKAVISELLPRFSTGNLRRTEEFTEALDLIQVTDLESSALTDLLESSA